jgi:hypothetical protein
LQDNLWAETSAHVWIVAETGMLHDQAEVRCSELTISLP